MEHHFVEAFIPIFFFLVVGAVVVATMVLKYYKRKLESTEILAAIEKGVEVQFPDQQKTRLLPGLIWTLTGIVITLGMAMATPEHAPSGIWAWGLIPVAVGAAYLIVYYIENKQGDSEQD